MSTICEYTTVAKVHTYKDLVSIASDALILDMIRQASREIEDICNRWFFPRILTHYYDTPRTPELQFSQDLLELTTLTNGDGTVITSSNYKLYPLNDYPKNRLILLPIQYAWQNTPYGHPYGAISLVGMFGFHDNYPDAWETSGATLSAAITTTTATTTTATSNIINPGDLLKIDSEYIYAQVVTLGASDTLTIVRGVNGSTAATHLINAPILRWNPGQEIEMLVRRGAAAYTKLRANPLTDTTTVDGVTFSHPKDVNKWMDTQLRTMGMIRAGAA